MTATSVVQCRSYDVEIFIRPVDGRRCKLERAMEDRGAFWSGLTFVDVSNASAEEFTLDFVSQENKRLRLLGLKISEYELSWKGTGEREQILHYADSSFLSIY